MKKQLPKVFDFNGTQIRTVIIDGIVWFVGNEVAFILGYSNPTDALKKHVDEDDQISIRYKSASRKTREALWNSNNSDYSNKVLINESGLYSLALNSKLPNAKQFKRWVTSEVLPSIHNQGAYITEQTAEKWLEDPDVMILALQELKSVRDANKVLTDQNNQMKPKAIFADSVSVSKTNISVGQLSKILKQEGIEIGEKRLFKWMRDNGYLIKRKGPDWNMPTQKSMNLKIFRVKESTRTLPDGTTSIDRTTKVTGKGQIYFVNKFKKLDGQGNLF